MVVVGVGCSVGNFYSSGFGHKKGLTVLGLGGSGARKGARGVENKHENSSVRYWRMYR